MLGKTGPETRFVLEQADYFFTRVEGLMFKRYIKPIRDWLVQIGLITGKINGGFPPDNKANPFLCRVRGPRKVTIDDRNYHKNCIERIRAGLMTEEDYYSALGLDAKSERRQRGEELRDWQQLAEEIGFNYHDAVRPLPGELNQGADQNSDPSQDPPAKD